eukprot:2169180-Amphidinium_carterae.1
MLQTRQEQPDIYARLRDKTTSLGVSFAKCMKSGMDIQGRSDKQTLQENNKGGKSRSWAQPIEVQSTATPIPVQPRK